MTRSADLDGASILVTGAGGFVGSHLVRRLVAEGARVYAVTRANCDLADPSAVRDAVGRAHPDLVFHLAAARATATPHDRERSSLVNTFSGRWVIEALPDSCRVVVNLGSSTEYAASSRPMDERIPLHPRGFYGATKAAGSILFASAAADHGIPSRTLRAFQVYGAADKPHRFVPTVLAAARDGRPLELTIPGLRRDWIWVGDVVDGCIRAATTDVGSAAVYNLGTGVQTTNEDLVQLAREVTGRPINARSGTVPQREWDAADWVSDSSAARRDLGWAPAVDLRTGLQRCWEAAA